MVDARRVVMAGVVLLLGYATPHAAVDPARRCANAKLRAAARMVRAYYDCYAQRAADGQAVDPSCLFAAHALLPPFIAAADAIGPCPGEAEAINNAICVPDLSGGEPRCWSKKYIAAATKFTARLRCHAKALRAGRQPTPECF